MRGQSWTDRENDLTVADYFAMLEKEMAGRGYIKAAHRRKLLKRVDRSEPAIEFKHRNISSILQRLGLVWIEGYRPAPNIQRGLADAVMRRLEDHPGRFVGDLDRGYPDRPVETSPIIPLCTPPTLSNRPPPEEPEWMRDLVRKFDPAERDRRNRALGKAGERRALDHEKAVLKSAGRDDLARRVEWVADRDGDGAGYDIASFGPDGRPRLIEVKTTVGCERTPFHITRNELRVAKERQDEWYLLRLWNFSRQPRAFELRPPLERHVSLAPTSFRASFG